MWRNACLLSQISHVRLEINEGAYQKSARGTVFSRTRTAHLALQSAQAGAAGQQEVDIGAGEVSSDDGLGTIEITSEAL